VSIGLLTDVDKAVADAAGDTTEQHALESPIGEINQRFAFRRFAGQNIAEVITGQEIGSGPAKFTLKESIRFRQNGRRTALRALMLNKEIKVFHRTGCNKSNC
jgi:hypothetical protein